MRCRVTSGSIAGRRDAWPQRIRPGGPGRQPLRPRHIPNESISNRSGCGGVGRSGDPVAPSWQGDGRARPPGGALLEVALPSPSTFPGSRHGRPRFRSTTSVDRRSTPGTGPSSTSASPTSPSCCTSTIVRRSRGPSSGDGSSTRCSAPTTCSGTSTASTAANRHGRASRRSRRRARIRSTSTGGGCGRRAWPSSPGTAASPCPSCTRSCTSTATRSPTSRRGRRSRMPWRWRCGRVEPGVPSAVTTRSPGGTGRCAGGGRLRRRCCTRSTRCSSGTRSGGGPRRPTTAGRTRRQA